MSKLTTHQRKARDLMQREDWDGALTELQRVLGVDANNPALHNQIGDVYLRKGDVEQACDHFELAVDLYSTLGLQNNAVALCRKVVRLAPSRIDVRYNLARLRMDQGLRSDATAAFVDYLEHAQPEDGASADAFEKRCVDVVEEYPEIAPAGQILEKLEAVNRPAGAYKIVQRLAQRAADSGDTAAATRLTEKMRSLRVLLESNPDVEFDDAADQSRSSAIVDPSTIDLDVAQPEVDLTDVAEAAAPEVDLTDVAEAAVPEVDLTDVAEAAVPEIDLTDVVEAAVPEVDLTDIAEAAVPEVDLTDVAEAAVPEIDLTDAVEAAVPEVDLTEVADAAEIESANNVEENVAEIDLDGVDSLDDTVAELQEVLSQDAQPTVVEEPAADSLPKDAGPSQSVPEYELPETSMEEVASLLEQEGVEPTPDAVSVLDPSEGTLAEDDVDVEVAELLQPEVADEMPLEELPSAAAPAEVSTADAASIADTFADPQEPPASETAAGNGISQLDPDDRPASVVYEPSTEPRLYPSSSDSQLRREPVWIPSPDTQSADPTPEEDGQVQELEEVIDTFREQMSRALGDDGSARYDLGVAYYEMGLYNEALAEFEVAVRCPGLADRTLEMMASCLAQEGRHSEIVSLLEEPLASATESSPDRLALQYAMGLALEATGQDDDARRHFEEVALVDIGFKDIQSRLQR